MSDRTQIISNPFHAREDARVEERVVQAFLQGIELAGGQFEGNDSLEFNGYTIPAWAKGVRVESDANGKQHVLVATEHPGH